MLKSKFLWFVFVLYDVMIKKDEYLDNKKKMVNIYKCNMV